MIRTFALLLSLLLASTAASAEEAKWQAFLVAGESALTKRNFTEAEKLFRAALREASAFDKTDERRGITLNHLATTLSAQRHYGHAEPVLLQAMTVWEESPPGNALHLATTQHHLAGIYHARGEYEAAAKLLVGAMEIRERSLPADHPALKHTRKSMAALAAVLGEDHYVLQGRKPAGKRSAKTPAKPIKVKATAPKAEKTAARIAAKTEQAESKGKKREKTPLQLAPTSEPTVAKSEKAGRFVLHLASFKTVKAANQAWSRLQSSYAEVLGDLALILQAADLGDQGTFQRILAGPLQQKTAARDLCERLKGKGQYCAVVPIPTELGQRHKQAAEKS